MTTKQEERPKLNKSRFEELYNKIEDDDYQLKKRLYQELDEMERIEDSKKEKQKFKKRLLLKRNVMDNYVADDREKDMMEVPVDGDVKKGSQVFMKNCANCHSMEMIDTSNRKGPSLGLIYGRKAGSNTSFTAYSQQFLKKKFYWTGINLYNFMANPKSLVSNSNCMLMRKPIQNQQVRGDLIALFREYTQELALNSKIKEIKAHGYDKYQTQLHVLREQKKLIQTNTHLKQNFERRP